MQDRLRVVVYKHRVHRVPRYPPEFRQRKDDWQTSPGFAGSSYPDPMDHLLPYPSRTKPSFHQPYTYQPLSSSHQFPEDYPSRGYHPANALRDQRKRLVEQRADRYRRYECYLEEYLPGWGSVRFQEQFPNRGKVAHTGKWSWYQNNR